MDERLINIIINSFPKILELGLKVTIPVSLASFILAFNISTCSLYSICPYKGINTII